MTSTKSFACSKRLVGATRGSFVVVLMLTFNVFPCKLPGANLDFRGPAMMARETPLHIAATYGKFAVVKALVDAGELIKR